MLFYIYLLALAVYINNSILSYYPKYIAVLIILALSLNSLNPPLDLY